MSAAKKTPPTKTKTKRPPRQVWLLVTTRGEAVGVYPTRKAATFFAGLAMSIVGPYVLAERVRER